MPTPGNRANDADAAERARRRREFGSRLRELRQAAGMTQETVALEAGLDRSFYVQLEGGKRTVSVERLWDIATALSVDVTVLFRETDSDG